MSLQAKDSLTQAVRVATAEEISVRCNCSYPTTRISELGVSCFANNPTAVTVHGKLQGAVGGLNTSKIVSLVQVWVESGNLSVNLTGRVLDLDRETVVAISKGSSGVCEPMDTTPTTSPTSGGPTTDQPTTAIVTMMESQGTLVTASHLPTLTVTVSLIVMLLGH